jgi:hypothetical protein
MNVQDTGGKSTMLQQSRTIRGMLVLWGLSLGMVIAGCGGGGDSSAPINTPPQNFAPPTALSYPHNGFSYRSGEPFHIDPTLGEVLLFFGDFHGTNAAPFTLVAGGFRATGTATWLNIYALSVQESTFPAAQGPQVGDQLLIDFIDTAPRVQEVKVPPNSPKDFSTFQFSGSPIDVIRTCAAPTVAAAPVDLGTLQPAGCIAVNGTINLQEAPLGMPSDTLKLTLQPSNLIVQFVLSFAVSTARDAADVDFNLFIRRKDDNSLLQSCIASRFSSKRGQEACAIVLQQTDFTPGSPLPVTVTVQSYIPVVPNEVFQGTGNYTLEILSNMSSEVGERTTICPDTGPSVILEQEPNGKAVANLPQGPGIYVFEPEPMPFQDAGMLHKDGCIPIRGGHIGASIIDADIDRSTGLVLNSAEADAVDNFEFSVESTVSLVALFLTPTNLNNDFILVIDEPPATPQGSFIRLAECRTTVFPIRPSTPVTACAVTVPPSHRLRVGVRTDIICATKACPVESDYSLDIIAVVPPSIPLAPIGAPPSPPGLVFTP